MQTTKDTTGKKHILVVSQYFYPEQFRINDICKEWVKRGYKITVLTGIPNYPIGKFFKGYGLFKRRKEVIGGINIIRIPIIPRGKNPIGLICNYYSFVFSGFIWRQFTKIQVDEVFIFEVSPMTQARVGTGYARKRHIPCLLYVQDLWPENIIAVTGLSNKYVINYIDRMVDKIYKDCDHIFATSKSFVDAICERKVKVPREKVHFWPQYAEEIYKPVDKDTAQKEAIKFGIPNDDTFKVIFTGNVGTAQGLDILPEAAKRIKNENIVFVIVGEGRHLSDLKKLISENEVEDKFIFIDRQPAENISNLLCASDVAFLSFADNELWAKTIPAKLQTYIACGMPVLASASGETKRIIEEGKLGICTEIGNVQGLIDGLKIILNEDCEIMSRHALQYCQTNFDSKRLLDEIAEYL